MILIDMEVLYDTIMQQVGKCRIKIFDPSVNLILQDIRNAPVIEAEFVRHGHWTEEKTGSGLFDYRFQCSECKGYTPDKAYTIAPDFCPNCGAKMDGGKENV